VLEEHGMPKQLMKSSLQKSTASGTIKHYETTLERVRDYYGIVTHLHEFQEIIKLLEQINIRKVDYDASAEHISEFLEKHNLIDISKAR
jgi:ureidoacrylate peracid hydrolase